MNGVREIKSPSNAQSFGPQIPKFADTTLQEFPGASDEVVLDNFYFQKDNLKSH